MIPFTDFVFSANKSRTFYICDSPKNFVCVCASFFVVKSIALIPIEFVRPVMDRLCIRLHIILPQNSLVPVSKLFHVKQLIGIIYLFISIEREEIMSFWVGVLLDCNFLFNLFGATSAGEFIPFAGHFFLPTFMHVLCIQRNFEQNGSMNSKKMQTMFTKKWIPDGVALQNKRRRFIVLMGFFLQQIIGMHVCDNMWISAVQKHTFKSFRF